MRLVPTAESAVSVRKGTASSRHNGKRLWRRYDAPYVGNTYVALNQTKNCSFPEALAQICWVHREHNGTLHVDEDY